MGKGKSTGLAGVMALLVFGTMGMAWGADIAKIGVLDFQKVLTISEAGKAAQAEINAKGKEMETQLKKEGDTLEELRKRLERETLVMSKEKREEKEREFRIKVNDFKALQKKLASDFKEIEKGYIAKIQKDVLELIEKMGKKEGYLAVLERREGGLLYFPQSIDMTDRVIQLYNEEFSKEGKKSDHPSKAPAKPKD